MKKKITVISIHAEKELGEIQSQFVTKNQQITDRRKLSQPDGKNL